jgi:thiol-disulfide isomerase/thioredoxin
MGKSIVIFVLCFFWGKMCTSQEVKSDSFEIIGSINAKDGEIMLIMCGDSTFYPEGLRHVKVPVINGTFHVKKQTSNPLGYQIQYNKSYISKMIVVYQGQQQIKCNVDSSREMPVIIGGMPDEQLRYNTTFKDLRSKAKVLGEKRAVLIKSYKSGLPDSIKNFFAQSYTSLDSENDQTLLKFVKGNPTSYLGLWQTISLTDFGYESIFNELYSSFSDSLKNSYPGKILKTKINAGSVLSIGSTFPTLKLLDTYDRKTTDLYQSKNKYVLVDFWFSHCSPCISQFPSLVRTYKSFHRSGFEVISISTDELKFKADWKAGIKKYGLIWPNLWDQDGKQSAMISIRAYPTNFLIDAKGIIIQKNISMQELDIFLREHLDQ